MSRVAPYDRDSLKDELQKLADSYGITIEAIRDFITAYVLDED